MQGKKMCCISMPVLGLQTGAVLRGKISGHLRGFWMDVMTPVIAVIVIFMQRLIRSLFKRLPVITLEDMITVLK